MFRYFRKPVSLTVKDLPSIRGLYGVTMKKDGQVVAINGDGYAYAQSGDTVCTVARHPDLDFTAYGEYVNDGGVIYLFDTNQKLDYKTRYRNLARLVDKTMVLNPCVFTNDPFRHVRQHFNSQTTEGFILTPVHGKQRVFKYKLLNTVDFFIRDRQCWCLISRNQYDTLGLTGADNDQDDYFLIPFHPCREYAGDDDQRVVECLWKDGQWYKYRDRPDKTTQYLKTGCGVNNYKICLDHYENFLNPLTLDKIFSMI